MTRVVIGFHPCLGDGVSIPLRYNLSSKYYRCAGVLGGRVPGQRRRRHRAGGARRSLKAGDPASDRAGRGFGALRILSFVIFSLGPGRPRGGELKSNNGR